MAPEERPTIEGESAALIGMIAAATNTYDREMLAYRLALAARAEGEQAGIEKAIDICRRKRATHGRSIGLAAAQDALAALRSVAKEAESREDTRYLGTIAYREAYFADRLRPTEENEQ